LCAAFWSSFQLAFDLVKFMREVRTEAQKTTWPTRKETVQTTGIVLLMVVITALFFLTVDQLIGAGVRFLFAAGS
jgi:preprotein translocase subunit SecE